MSNRPKLKFPLKPQLQAIQPEPEAPQKKKPDYIRASLYFPPGVHKALRRLAFETERAQHEWLKDWIDAGLRQTIGKGWKELAGDVK
jgi:hypothetical protein